MDDQNNTPGNQGINSDNAASGNSRILNFFNNGNSLGLLGIVISLIVGLILILFLAFVVMGGVAVTAVITNSVGNNRLEAVITSLDQNQNSDSHDKDTTCLLYTSPSPRDA